MPLGPGSNASDQENAMLFILIEDMDELFGNQVRCCMPYHKGLFCPFGQGQEFVRDLAHLLLKRI